MSDKKKIELEIIDPGGSALGFMTEPFAMDHTRNLVRQAWEVFAIVCDFLERARS
jgi:hypothetical protein